MRRFIVLALVLVALTAVGEAFSGRTNAASEAATVLPGQGVSFKQVDFTWAEPTALNSSTGQVDVDIAALQASTGVPSGFVNVSTNLGWVVQNLPVPSGFPYPSISTRFQISDASGVNITSLDAFTVFSLEPLTTAPVGPVATFPVGDTQFNGGGLDSPAIASGSSSPQSRGIAGAPSASVSRFCFQAGHQNVQAAANQCAPSAVANSLQWLETTYGIVVPHDNVLGLRGSPSNSLVGQLDLTMGRDATSRASGHGVSAREALVGKLAYLGNNGLGGVLDVQHQQFPHYAEGDDRFGDDDITASGVTSTGQGHPMAEFIIDEICSGAAVEFAYFTCFPEGWPLPWPWDESCGGHMVEVVGAGTDGQGSYYVYYMSDHLQTDQDPTDTLGTVGVDYSSLSQMDPYSTLVLADEPFDPIISLVISESLLPVVGDRDHDGIPDASDQCPDEAEDRDGFEDTDGCPEPGPNQPPVADANGSYVTNEGTNVILDGTGSSDPEGDPLTYAWDLDNDGAFDDARGPTPTFDMVGQDGVFTVRLRVTDPGGLSDQDETTVTVNNVAPSVSLASDAPKDEGSAVTVSGTVTDPGWLDPLSATIDWGDGTPAEPVGGTLENERPDATLTFSVSHVYGDNGVFTAEVCASDDDTTTCEPINLQVDNVDPTAEIDESGAIAVNGVPTFFSRIGEPLNMSGRSTDPGSDDLYLSWDWDDGSPVVTTTYLVNPPNPDPFPSPSIQPRDVTDAQGHTYGAACLYEVKFWAADDDGGLSPVDTANVIIVGNAEEVRTAGYWLHDYRGTGLSHFDEATLNCYLAITGHMSQVFDEVTDASTMEKAADVLHDDQKNGSMQEIFDRQLLAAWLNFANGSIDLDQMVDTNRDRKPDTTFWNAVIAAEAVRLNPAATRWQLEQQKNILERINMMGG